MTTTTISPPLLSKAYPAISVILPLHPGFPETKESKERIKKITEELKTRLHLKYGDELSDLMTDRVENILSGSGKLRLRDSLFIFLSRDTEKVFSLPIIVEEKLIVDETFEIRDLIYAAQQDLRYLLVNITGNRVKTFLIDSLHVAELDFPNMPENIRDVETTHSFPGREYFDSKAYKEKNVINYLHFIDVEMKKFVAETNYPVIMMGESKFLGNYKKHTSISGSIMGYLEGNFEHLSMSEIRRRIQPIIEKNLINKQNHILDLLDEAIGINHYACGIEDVWEAATESRGRILIVEKDYKVRARRAMDGYTISSLEENDSINPHSIIEDAVDDAIQLVLSKGGEVWFTEKGVLQKYDSIALITRY